MAAVRLGGDRQKLHGRIAEHSHAVTAQIKAGGVNDLVDRLTADGAFRGIDFSRALDPSEYVGRAPEQVDEFLSEEVEPALARFGDQEEMETEIRV
jgi:adenylosuccinate lyase